MLERARFQGSFQYYSECQDVEVKPVPLLDKWKKKLEWLHNRELCTTRVNERVPRTDEQYSMWDTSGAGENKCCKITHEKYFSSYMLFIL